MMGREKIRRILGGRSPAQFAKLPKETREKIFRRHLVRAAGNDDHSRDPVYPSDIRKEDPRIADGVMLRQEYFMGDDEVGRQLVDEARDIYYAKNWFKVDSNLLYEFMSDHFADGVPIPIESRVQNITVRVNIHDQRRPNDLDSDLGLEGCVAKDLRQLLKFTAAEKVEVMLWGSGNRNGYDLATQRKIKEISGVVAELIGQFGSKLRVIRAAGKEAVWIQSYWNEPSEDSQRNFWEGNATMYEAMQIQIQQWKRSAHE